MSDWDEPKTVIGFKRQVAKVAKKDSDINGPLNSFSMCAPFWLDVSIAVGLLYFRLPVRLQILHYLRHEDQVL